MAKGQKRSKELRKPKANAGKKGNVPARPRGLGSKE